MKRILPTIILFLAMALCSSLVTSCHTSKEAARDYYQSQIDQLKTHPESTRKNRHGKKPTKMGKEIVDEAYTWLGTPYRYACSEKGVATDCSGMVLQVYDKITGIKLPRNSAKQAEYCKSIKQKEVKIGDLIFFATGKNEDTISHVGIMVDEKNFIHASASKGVVISDMTQPYYVRTFKGFGRVK
ncbi:MAG: C40 family peptidase [Muribaculaceae bacterium]|nr:C40 family peptidase [Muribaculaceae bacterium]